MAIWRMGQLRQQYRNAIVFINGLLGPGAPPRLGSETVLSPILNDKEIGREVGLSRESDHRLSARSHGWQAAQGPLLPTSLQRGLVLSAAQQIGWHERALRHAD